MNASLDFSLNELSRADEYAREENMTPPSDLVKKETERVLRALHERFPHEYEVYPAEINEMAIDWNNSDTNRGLLFLVGEEKTLVFFTLRGEKKNWHESMKTSEVPDNPRIWESMEIVGYRQEEKRT